MSALVHPTAVIDEGAVIGEDTRIWHFVHVSSGARIGARCILGQNVFVGRNVSIGDGVKAQNNVSIYEAVTIEDDVFLGPSCVFTNVMTPRAAIDRKSELAPTLVRRGATIGANATIVCGVVIGEHAFVGAGAVVTRDVPAHALVVGNPARRIGWVSRAGERLPPGPRPRCPRTGERYIIDGESCRLDEGDLEEDDPGADEPIAMADLRAQHAEIAGELRAAFDRVLESGQFILGEEVSRFETALARTIGVQHAIGVSSGTDGLLLVLMALGIGPGDEVITSPFSFFATAGSIVRAGARPVFVDIDPRSFNLDPGLIARAITARTRAIMPVHLFGRSADVDAIAKVAGDIPIIEDAAQAIGARHLDRAVGALGRAAVFSFFPAKNLGALGDAGAITTDDHALAERMRSLRHHGQREKYVHTEIGGNFRLDALQAAMLSAKLPHLPRWTEARRKNAALYRELLGELPEDVLCCPDTSDRGQVFNQLVVRARERDALRAHLSLHAIATEIYYPTPLHLQPALRALGYGAGSFPHAERAAREVLALPVHAELRASQIRRIARAVIEHLAPETRR